MAEFSQDVETSKVQGLVDELFEHVLYDEEPLFVSDEATLWGVSMSDAEDVLERCRKYYGVSVSMADTQLPLWRMLLALDARRKGLPEK
jgi:hypothetical protein